MYDKYSGRSRRLVFVMMKTIEDANVVIKKLNGIVSVTYSLSCYKCNKIFCYYQCHLSL